MGGGHSFGFDNSVLIFFGIAWMLFEAGSIIAGSIFGAYVNDVVPHAVMGKFYGMSRFISLMAGIFFMGSLFGHAKQHYVAIFVGIGLLYGFGFTGSCLKVKEGPYPPPPVDDTGGPPSPIRAAITYFRDCFGKPYYLWVFASMILPGLAFSCVFGFNYRFSQSVGMSDGQYGRLTAFYFFLSMLQAIPLGWLADKFHPLRLAIVTLAVHCVVAITGGLLIHDARSYAVAFVLTGMLQGTWYTVTAAVGPLLLPKDKFAQYGSAVGILGTLIGITFSPSVGRMLDLTHSTYRYTYLLGGVMDLLALTATIVVFRKFLALGGAKRYVAP
jgi:hypothetical protein